MKIDSTGIREDALMLLNALRRKDPDSTPDENKAVDEFVPIALNLIISRIDHDLIETEDDLKQCTADIVRRVVSATKVLTSDCDIIVVERSK